MGARILATDLDRTLLPNGKWPADGEAIDRFNRLTVEHGLTVVYVTGRSLALTQAALDEFGVRPPDVLCGDVGTTIRRYDGGAWTPDPGWDHRVLEACPRWSMEGIKTAVAGIGGLVEQAAEHNNHFKQSYYVDLERKDAVLAEVSERVAERFDEVIVYSYDSKDHLGLLDLLPRAATKRTALEYVAEAYGVPKGEVVFCGDSGNDIFPLTAGFRGVLVRNADAQLVENVRAAMAENPALEVYFAKGDFQGLSGYYTSGVIEGAHHYGLFG